MLFQVVVQCTRKKQHVILGESDLLLPEKLSSSFCNSEIKDYGKYPSLHEYYPGTDF